MPKKGRGSIGAGCIENDPAQTIHHVEAGTVGRLISACMNIARNHPEWVAKGRVEEVRNPVTGKTTFRTRLERTPTEHPTQEARAMTEREAEEWMRRLREGIDSDGKTLTNIHEIARHEHKRGWNAAVDTVQKFLPTKV